MHYGSHRWKYTVLDHNIISHESPHPIPDQISYIIKHPTVIRETPPLYGWHLPLPLSMISHVTITIPVPIHASHTIPIDPTHAAFLKPERVNTITITHIAGSQVEAPVAV